jgi:two-component system, chemotaxis family, CheB/CheR fusion protein
VSDSKKASDHSDSKLAGNENTGVQFPVVGIGASAGGLEAFSELLSALPENTGMAFVLVQHLDPSHESQLPQILSRATIMPVQQIMDGINIKPNVVYVIPPNARLTIAGGTLRLTPRRADHVPYLPIDGFFESLAADEGRFSIGVILSGSGNDGTQGLKAIKEQCGVTFAQTEKSAKFGGMPHSAMASSAADFVLSPAEIARELVRISLHPYAAEATENNAQQRLPENNSTLQKIFSLVHKATGVDFSHYKQTTTRRRIERRMIVNRSQNLAEYLTYLEGHPEEAQELYKDTLISVTRFFRDPDSFQALMTLVSSYLRSRSRDSFRIWVPGCATGEEVYSLAISFQELFLNESPRPALQIFGTEISELALGKARAGRYTEAITQDVSPARLQQFFHKLDGHYQINKSIRDCCIFAKQDVTRDPPFSRVDLISCRNTLIYLDQALQRTVMPVFHYSLIEDGFLFLGPAETVGAASDLFDAVDQRHRIFVRKSVPVRFTFSRTLPRSLFAVTPGSDFSVPANLDWQKQADFLIQNRYAPDGVIINQDLSLVQTRGRTSYYLQSAALGTTQNLLLLAHESLQFPIREAALTAIAKNIPVQRRGLHLQYQGEEREINLEIIPLSPASARDRYYFVLFERTDHYLPVHETLVHPPEPQSPEQENVELRQRLAQVYDYLRTLTEEHDVALEEQKASNEEIGSANEELQSTNEELSTAKEELQSVNEELTTVNEELQSRNQELGTFVNDLTNLFAAVNTPILIFDRFLRLRRFTPAGERYLGLSSADLGRAIPDLPLRTNVPQLEQLVSRVIDDLTVETYEMQDRHDCWWSLSIRPYLTLDHRIEGAILTFVDVNTLKRTLWAAEESRDYAAGIVSTVREPLLVLSATLRVERANQAFYRTFQLTPEDTEGRLIYELDNGQWNMPQLRNLLEEIVPQNSFFEDLPVERDFPRIGWRSMSLNARQILEDGRGAPRILLAIEDITARKVAEGKLARFYKDLEQFGYAIAHDLQAPLHTLSNYSRRLIERQTHELDSESDQILGALVDGVERMERMVQDLLAYSQALSTGGGLQERVSLEATLQEVLWNLQAAVEESGASITHDELPTVQASRLLTLVLQNLVENSIKYRGAAPPRIHISATRRAKEWEISVRDNGIGFDQRHAEGIFELFTRLEGRKCPGTGVGLALCQRVVERCGGRMWAESEPGVGSTFHFTIPVAEHAVQNSAHA